jgi:hypothetical protein
MKVYCIRQKSTGLFIPRLETGKRRGGSHLEPSNKREPRIFHNKLAARAFLGNWLRGIFQVDYYTESGVEESDVSVIPQPHRKKDDMEIVEFICLEQRQHDFYKTGDYDAPAEIKDRNGDVVLQMCRVCHTAEAGLAEFCWPPHDPTQ